MGEGLLCTHTVELQAGSGCPCEASLEKGPDELESDLQDGGGGGVGAVVEAQQEASWPHRRQVNLLHVTLRSDS